MQTPAIRKNAAFPEAFTLNTRDFDARVAEGLRRAPIERAQAFRTFWDLVSGRSK